MRPRIAIPLPLSHDPQHVERSLPQYERAVEAAGGEPVRIPLDQSTSAVMKIIERCEAVLLPGSSADVDPAKYEASKHEKTAPADPQRDAVDELLLQDAYNMRKPILGICYGLQILNVYRTGTLIQHITSSVNHEAGSKIAIAHTVLIDRRSNLAKIVNCNAASSPPPAIPGGNLEASRQRIETETIGVANSRFDGADSPRRPVSSGPWGDPSSEDLPLVLAVNSSHHQSAEVLGAGLTVVAHCPDDGIIEAIEGTSADHFVLGVQWHPERSANHDPASQAIFQALVEAARNYCRAKSVPG